VQLVTEYLHGTSQLGEQEENHLGTAYLPMSLTKPTGSMAKSIGVTSYGQGPDPTCAGSHDAPVWIVAAKGSLAAPPTVVLAAASTFGTTADVGGGVEIRLYADVTSQVCQATTLGAPPPPEPIATATITLPVAPATISVKLDLASRHPVFKHHLMLQITPVLAPIFTGRVLYDSTDYPSRLVLSCTPPVRQRSC
jgi:hypothetical protein